MSMKYHHMSFGKKEQRITLVHLNKPISMGLIGMVKSDLFAENIALVIDSTPESERDYDFACLAYAAQMRHPRILLERELFYDVIRGSAEARTIFFHEIGHYANQDCETPGFNNDSYRSDRMTTTEGNEVLSYEAAADDFAVRYLGCTTVRDGLKQLLARVKATYDNGEYDEDEVAMVVNELEMRIKRLQ